MQHVRIVGNGLRSVESVTGRLTNGRAALAEATSGAWFGLLLGLLIGLFDSRSVWLAVLPGSLLISMFWGAAFGFLAHRATRGQRDVSSHKGLEAEQSWRGTPASY